MRCSSLPSSGHLTTSTTFPLAASGVRHCGRLVGELPRPASADIDDTEALCHVEKSKGDPT
jgi:hypothetical protein